MCVGESVCVLSFEWVVEGKACRQAGNCLHVCLASDGADMVVCWPP